MMDSFFADHNYSLSSFNSSSDHLSSLSPPDAAESDHEPPSEARFRSSSSDDDDQLLFGSGDVNLNSLAQISDDDEDLNLFNPSLRTTGGETLVFHSTPNQNLYSPFKVPESYSPISIDSGIGSPASLMSPMSTDGYPTPREPERTQPIFPDLDTMINQFNEELNLPATSDDWVMDMPIKSVTKEKEPPEVQIPEVEPQDDDQTQEEPESPEVENNDALDAAEVEDAGVERFTIDFIICELNYMNVLEVLIKWTGYPDPDWTLTKYVDENGGEMKRFRAHMELFERWKLKNGVHESARYGECLGRIGTLIAQSPALLTNDHIRVCFDRIFYNALPPSDESTHLFLFNVESYINSFEGIEHDLTEDLKFNTAELKSITNFLGQLLDGHFFKVADEVPEKVANGRKRAAKRRTRKRCRNRKVVEVPVAGPSRLQRRVLPRLTKKVVQKPETASKSRKRKSAPAENLRNTAKRPRRQLPADSSEEDEEPEMFHIEVILFEMRTPPLNIKKVLVKWLNYTETTWEPISNVTINPKGISMMRHRLHVRSFTAWKVLHANDNFEAVLRNTATSLAALRRRDIKELFTARIDELIEDRELLVPEVAKWVLFNLDCYLNYKPLQNRKSKEYDESYTKTNLETICKLTVNLELPN